MRQGRGQDENVFAPSSGLGLAARAFMTTHPVQLHIERPEQLLRVQVFIRLIFWVALGTIGCSSVYWLIYLGLPAFAALSILQAGSGEGYLSAWAPRLAPALRWLASAYAYLWLLTDDLPGSESVRLTLEPSGVPTAQSALLRLLTSLPALLILAVLSFIAGVLLIFMAVVVLVRGRPSIAAADFIGAMLRYQFRLIAYHLSLVDRYPSLEESPAAHEISERV